MGQQIVVPDDFPIAISGTAAEDKLRTLGDVRIHCEKAETDEELIERINDCDAVINIRAYSKFTRPLLDACPNLRMLSIWGTGTDNVDLKAAKELGITVTNTPGANALSVAEHTIAILLALVRQIPHLDRGTRKGEWPRVEMVQMSGKVLGLFGLGAIGKHVARMAHGLGMEVIAWTKNPSAERAKESNVRFVPREELLKSADVVSLHLILSDETVGFLKKDDLDLMKPNAFFVNTARAALVEPGALEETLQSGKIAGAGLDVYDQEPLPADHPLTTMTNVVLTPHNSGMTPEATISGLVMAVENVEAFLAGNQVPANCLVVEGNR
jgi:D-3-phosphoglycerate dehydrogenase